MTPNTVYNVKKFLLPDSGNSCALFHAKIYDDNEYIFHIHDCHSGIRLRGNLSSDIGKKEAIEKIEALMNGLSQFKEFIESEFTLLNELKNYVPKGKLKGFPLEVIGRMLEEQKLQGNNRNIAAFETDRLINKITNGFNWESTEAGFIFWESVIYDMNFDIFFKKYPKQLNKED